MLPKVFKRTCSTCETTEKVSDVAIIGSGTAGMSAYRAAREHTARVVLIESGPYGTTCARVGCMPSKLLIAAADAAHRARKAPVFGVHPGPLRIDGGEVMQRVRSERDRFVGFVAEAVAQWPAEHRLIGHARFIDANDGTVRQQTLVALLGNEGQRFVQRKLGGELEIERHEDFLCAR